MTTLVDVVLGTVTNDIVQHYSPVPLAEGRVERGLGGTWIT